MLDINDMIGKIHCGDCLEVMKQMPDKCVDLVLTDPPYGINADLEANRAAMSRIKADGKSKAGRGWKLYENFGWDSSRPNIEIFQEIQRISKNSIIWGGNYFADMLPARMGWLVWDKGQREFSLADGELAWTSFDKALRIFTYSRGAALQDGKQHPTQKPEALMRWCLNERSEKGQVVFDPFLGSGTTAVAAERLGRRWIGIEMEPKYCAIAQARVDAERNQLKLPGMI